MSQNATTGRRRGRPGRPRGDRRTRDALLGAAVRLLQEEGEAAVSTTRLTREAGIVQSSFYNHFPSRDACLDEAAGLIAEQLRQPLLASLSRLRREEIELDERSGEPARAHFRRVLDLLMPRWAVFSNMREGRDGSPVTRRMRQLRGEMVSDVADYVRTYAAHAGIDLAEPDLRVDLLAVLLTDLTLCAAQELAHSLGTDPNLVATMLGDCARAMVVRIIHGGGIELTWTDRKDL